MLTLRLPSLQIQKSRGGEKSGGFVVSLTSFPQRIEQTWAVVECLLRQTRAPIKIVLYLDRDEFPKDWKLPHSLEKRLDDIFSVRWVIGGGRSYNKLIHAIQEFPKHVIVTVDDDKLIPASYLQAIWELHERYPRSIVGGRGWAIRPSKADGKVIFGKNWRRANPGETGQYLFLPGVDGVLYPPQSLHPVVTDLELAKAIAPTNDDIWFWACAMVNATNFVCAGLGRLTELPGLERAPKLNQTNSNGVSDQQFWATIKALGVTLQLAKE